MTNTQPTPQEYDTMALLKLTTLIAKVNKLDAEQVEAQLEIANLLTAIANHELYTQEGYASFAMMIAGETTMPVSTASRYLSLHRSFTTLKYTKKEFLRLMQQFGWGSLQRVLSGADKKLGRVAIQNRKAAMDACRYAQINFSLSDSAEIKRIERSLERFGMEVSKGGTRTHMSDALLALLDDYDRLLSQVSSKAKSA